MPGGRHIAGGRGIVIAMSRQTTDPRTIHGVTLGDGVTDADAAVHRFDGGPSDGVVTVTLTAGDCRATLCPTRGLGVLDFSRDATTLGWDSPSGPGPVPPWRVDLASRGGLGWLDGFTELVVRCGLSFNGPPGHDAGGPPLEQDITLHGRIANRPAAAVRVDRNGESVTCTGSVREAVLFGVGLELRTAITLHPGGRLIIEDTVHNIVARPQEMQLLYHINIDPRQLGDDTELTPPPGAMQPRDETAAAGIDRWTAIDPPTDGYAEQVFFVTPPDDGEEATTRLHSPSTGRGVEVTQSLGTLPSLSIWKCFQPAADGYVLGIEPGTGFPNFKADERAAGRVVVLQPGESRTHRVQLAIGD